MPYKTKKANRKKEKKKILKPRKKKKQQSSNQYKGQMQMEPLQKYGHRNQRMRNN